MTATMPRAPRSTVVTPTLGRRAGRAAFWIAAGAFVLAIAVISAAVAGSATEGRPLSATNAAPNGAKALVEVLRSQGVEVTATDSLLETAEAIDDPTATTLVVYDVDSYLTDDRVETAVGLADRVILIAPDFSGLQAAAPDVAQAGDVGGEIDADCAVRAIQNAGTVTGDGSGYRLIDDTTNAVTCLGSGDDVFSLIELDRGAETLTVLGTTDALSNEFIADRGNAALALTLLGDSPNLVWYIPTFDDVEDTGGPTLAELTPGWVIPALLLATLTALAAAIWRGRRFGPLVVENLPVTVRASETMEGRARLYASASARLRALDALRIGTVDRIARACGLSRTATIDEVVLAAAGAIGAVTREVRRVLVDADPQSDAELVSLSDELLTLEKAVHAATRPPAGTPAGLPHERE